MILLVKIGVFGITLVFVFVMFVLLDALDSLYTRSRGNMPNTDEFNRKLRKFILYCMLPLGGFAMCVAGYSMIAEMLGL